MTTALMKVMTIDGAMGHVTSFMTMDRCGGYDDDNGDNGCIDDDDDIENCG